MSILNFCLESYGSEYSCYNKEKYMMNMLGRIPHQKFCFYLLPTRGRAGIKLGDAWYVSNVSIIFYCFMLYYIFLGLTYWPEPSASSCVFPCSRVSKKRNIKRSPNGMKPSKKLFLERKQYRRLGVHVRGSTRKPQGRGCAHPLGTPSTLVGPLWLPWCISSAYIYPYTLKLSGNTIDREFRRQKPS